MTATDDREPPARSLLGQVPDSRRHAHVRQRRWSAGATATQASAAALIRAIVVSMPSWRSASRSALPVHFVVIQVMTGPKGFSASNDSVNLVPVAIGSSS